MSRIVPGEPKERERRPPPEKTSTKEPCMRPECVANLNRINELKEGNEMLKEQVRMDRVGWCQEVVVTK
jgi:hypothetical protein